MLHLGQDVAARFGARLRRLRQGRRWSQARLAEALEVSLDHVGLLERGERLPSVGLLVRAAELLGASPDELLGWPGPVATQRIEASDRAVLGLLHSLPKRAREALLILAEMVHRVEGIEATSRVGRSGRRVATRRGDSRR